MDINPIEVDARLGMLTEQRNSALNHAVLLAGQVAMLQAQLAQLRAKPAPEDLGEVLQFRDRQSMTEP
jgi:hypothetical protein